LEVGHRTNETVGEMAIIQILLAALARSAGRILNTAVGWATTMIFGRVPEKRQIYVSVMTFGSLVWIAVIVGIAFPSAGTFLLSFVPLPSWVDRKWVRLAMTIAAAVLPALVGAVSLLLRDPDERPTGSARVRAVLRGYPFTARARGDTLDDVPAGTGDEAADPRAPVGQSAHPRRGGFRGLR
jgi:hypothetical protein